VSDEPTRRRLIGTMFGANALESTAFIGIATITPIIGAELTGSARLAGIPSTLATFGTASGALVLGWAGARIGRRRSFAIGYATAATAALVAAAAVDGNRFLLYCAAVFAVGFGRSASQLARYAAGDLRDETRRGTSISVIVWAATIGSVFGPLLIAPAGEWAESVGRPELVGPLVVAAIGFSLAGLVTITLLRPDPLALAIAADPQVDADDVARPADLRLGEILRRPTVTLSFVALIVSQLVMVLVMTMTPLHIRGVHHHLETVGWVMMAHTLGMFAIAPITGRLVDRYGADRLIGAGALVLMASCLGASSARGAETPILIVSLFGLGVGWNFGFVAASALLQEGLNIAERVRIQGVADATTWVSGGVGAAASGVVVAATSYTTLGLTGAGIASLVFVALARTSVPAKHT
jgi:MFS family permease